MKAFVTSIIVLIIAGFLFFASAFIVKETEQMVVLQFGEVVRLVDKPGLSFLIPFVQDAKRFDKRWLEWDGDANQITTRDKRYIYIDVFARWRIKEPLVFIETLRDETSALGRLDDILDNATRNVVANHRLIEVIRSSNRKFEYNVDEQLNSISSKDDNPPDKTADADGPQKENDTDTASPDEDKSLQDKAPKEIANGEQRLTGNAETYAIEEGRDRLTRLVLEKASAKASELGIELKDVQIKRINYIENVEAKVFDRMISERKRVAEAYRSEGQGRSAEILGRMEMELQQIQSEAYRESQKIMGRADAKAADIYAKAYNKNPDFYQFTKTMESYRQTVNNSYTLILSTDGDYLGHLQDMEGTPAGN